MGNGAKNKNKNILALISVRRDSDLSGLNSHFALCVFFSRLCSVVLGGDSDEGISHNSVVLYQYCVQVTPTGSGRSRRWLCWLKWCSGVRA